MATASINISRDGGQSASLSAAVPDDKAIEIIEAITQILAKASTEPVTPPAPEVSADATQEKE